MAQPSYAPAFPHDPITEIFPNVYFVHGSIKIGPGLRMNRNMVIIKQESDLTLINPVRINDNELKNLDQLGTVKHVIRLGDFHGLDDQFYIDRYQAQFWSQHGHETYKELIPHQIISAQTKPPIHNSDFFIFETAKYPEAALLIQPLRLLITTDSVQYWSDWSYFTPATKLIVKLMGFRLGLLIGGPWLKRVTPKGKSLQQDFAKLLTLDFDSLVSAHGAPLKSGAKQELTAVIKKTFNL
ncbi:MAG: hypothetical protein KGO49_05430 [Gammaproteobacteria bacterium]|nr:hypothetical protein [Gammaproteobacteria bacterium]